MSQNQNIKWGEGNYKNVKQSEASIKKESYLVAVEENRLVYPWIKNKITIIHTTRKSCITHSKYRGKATYSINYCYNNISVVVVLNWNQTFIQEYIRKIEKWKTKETHNPDLNKTWNLCLHLY